MEKSDQRRFMLAMGLSLVVLFLYQMFVVEPEARARRAAQAAKPAVESNQAAAPASPAAPLPRADVLTQDGATGGRVAFAGDGVDGSVSLRGATLNDLKLRRHFETVERKDEVALLSPRGASEAFYAFLGWTGAEGAPGETTVWTRVGAGDLTPQTPLVLTSTAGDLTFTRTIELDRDYMFTFTDTVANNGAAPVTIKPFGVARQHGLPPKWQPNQILHEGGIGVQGDVLRMRGYTKLQKGERLIKAADAATPWNGGWVGLTTKYWMTAFIPDASQPFQADVMAERDGLSTVYVARFEGAERVIAPGTQITTTNRIFAGAKSVAILERYHKELGVARFDDAVDWGFLWFFTKPFFWLLSLFQGWWGSFALALLGLTIVVKTAFFPIQFKAYESMSKMRKLAPEMENIKKRFAADPARQQKEVLALYQREKANPVAGCLPLIPQMFVFYALYKMLVVTLEMRHQPFFGWIQDMSAPDPTTIFNLFGLLPFQPQSIPLIGGLLALGAWPLMYGATMAALQALSPPPTDPTQKLVFAWMPVVFTFMFAGVAAGLAIYWTWSNLITLLQQYVIMRRTGVETELDKWLKRITSKKAGADS